MDIKCPMDDKKKTSLQNRNTNVHPWNCVKKGGFT